MVRHRLLMDIRMKTSRVFNAYVKTSTGRGLHFDVVLDDKEDDKALACAQYGSKA